MGGLGLRYAVKVIRALAAGGAAELVFFLIPCVAGMLLSVITVCENFHQFITAWFAPRIYIIETIAELAGKVTGK